MSSVVAAGAGSLDRDSDRHFARSNSSSSCCAASSHDSRAELKWSSCLFTSLDSEIQLLQLIFSLTCLRRRRRRHSPVPSTHPPSQPLTHLSPLSRSSCSRTARSSTRWPSRRVSRVLSTRTPDSDSASWLNKKSSPATRDLLSLTSRSLDSCLTPSLPLSLAAVAVRRHSCCRWWPLVVVVDVVVVVVVGM